MPEKRRRGRPSKFTPELAREICERLSVAEPLTVICRDDHMPSDETVRNWADADKQFSSDIARARELGWDHLANECETIANTPHMGERVEIEYDKKGKEISRKVHREDMLGHRKLQIDTRLKLLAKWDPKRYGEKIQQEFSGEVGVRGLGARMLERARARKKDDDETPT